MWEQLDNSWNVGDKHMDLIVLLCFVYVWKFHKFFNIEKNNNKLTWTQLVRLGKMRAKFWSVFKVYQWYYN